LALRNASDGLRLVEDPKAKPISHSKRKLDGTETNVGDVDELRKDTRIPHSLEIIGEPAYLPRSDAIKAMQTIGPAERVSYMTQV